MSVPNINIMQPQNIVINQVPMSHTIMTANNGALPVTNAIPNAGVSDQTPELKTGPMAMVNVSANAVQSANTSKVQLSNSTVNSNSVSDSLVTTQLLTKTRISDLVRDIDPNVQLDEEVEEILLSYVDDFVDRVLNGASLIAKHRHAAFIEVKDVQQFINRNYNMWAPGFGTDELRPYKRSLTTESHKQRLALIKKALKKY